MTREEAKQLLPIIQAWSEGKTIEFFSHEKWREMFVESPNFDYKPSCYRVKPEPKYRPFKSKEECWKELQKHQPFGWLKSKKNGRFRCIVEVSWSDEFETVYIALSTSEALSRCVDSVFDEYTFDDGAPFGVMEE